MPETKPTEAKIQGRALDLYRIARALNAATSLDETLKALLKSTAEEMGLRACSLRLVGPRRHTLRLIAAYGLSDEYLNKGPIDIERSAIDQTALEGKPVIIQEVTEDPRWQYPEAARKEGVRSVLVVPLSVEERVAGVLRAYSTVPYRFTDEEVAFLTAVADLGAMAIESARIHEALVKIAGAINSVNKLKDVLNAVVAGTAEEMMLKGCSIQLLNPDDSLAFEASYGLSEDYLSKGVIDVSRSPVAARVLAGETVMITDITKETGLQYTSEAIKEGIRSVLAVPLAIRDRVIGVMRVYAAAPQRFTHKEINFLKAIANLGALAIENAKLYEQLKDRYEGLKQDLSEWYNFLSLG
ncbi:MAG TPA: GAF domain-containing protein [Blastocatellia bacterium]|nr:GAF domain-containing protein [Blastocatellia bacterium]